MRKSLTALACAAALTLPAADAWAKKVATVSRSGTSPVVNVDRWGGLQVRIKMLVSTTTTATGKKTVHYKITEITFPVYPSHTDKSTYISQKALPMLRQEVLQATGSTIQIISGATDTSYGFVQALSDAISRART